MKNKILNKIPTILLILMVVGGVYFALSKNIYYSFLFILSFLFTWFVYKVIDVLKINQKYKIITAIVIWLNIAGEFYFYGNLQYYDKILHFIVPFFIASAFYDYIKKYKLEYPKVALLFLVLGMLASFELFEYFMDLSFELGMLGVQSPRRGVVMNELNDTMWDLIFGFLGVCGSIIFKSRKDGV